MKLEINCQHTCIARCRLDDYALAWDELSLLLRRFNHPLRYPILHGSACRHVLDLAHCNFLRTWGEAYGHEMLLTKVALEAFTVCDLVKSNERRVPDGIESIVKYTPGEWHCG